MRDANTPSSHWVLGRIVACHASDDGLVRVVTVKTAQSEYKRPTSKICFLPVKINDEGEPYSVTAGGEEFREVVTLAVELVEVPAEHCT